MMLIHDTGKIVGKINAQNSTYPATGVSHRHATSQTLIAQKQTKLSTSHTNLNKSSLVFVYSLIQHFVYLKMCFYETRTRNTRLDRPRCKFNKDDLHSMTTWLQNLTQNELQTNYINIVTSKQIKSLSLALTKFNHECLKELKIITKCEGRSFFTQ